MLFRSKTSIPNHRKEARQMSTLLWINTECMRLVREAARETNNIDGLEALKLLLEKMREKPGLITDLPALAHTNRLIVDKLETLTAQTSGKVAAP